MASARNFSLIYTVSMLLSAYASRFPAHNYGHGCSPNFYEAKADASSNWNWLWESHYAIKGLTWSSGRVHLRPDSNSDCHQQMTEDCPQWLQVDLGKPTEILFVEFESWSLWSAPTQFRIYGLRSKSREKDDPISKETHRPKSGTHKDNWKLLKNQDTPDIPTRSNKRRRFEIPHIRHSGHATFSKIKIEISAIVGSAEYNSGYVTISNLVICRKRNLESIGVHDRKTEKKVGYRHLYHCPRHVHRNRLRGRRFRRRRRHCLRM